MYLIVNTHFHLAIVFILGKSTTPMFFFRASYTLFGISIQDTCEVKTWKLGKRFLYDTLLDDRCLVHDLTPLRTTMGILELLYSLEWNIGLVDLGLRLEVDWTCCASSRKVLPGGYVDLWQCKRSTNYFLWVVFLHE